MSSVRPTVADQPNITPESAARFSELVKKIETNPSRAAQRRKNATKKRLKQVTKEQQRMAKANGLQAIAMTLTYRNNKDFSPLHISRFIDRLRSFLYRRGYSLPYAWVLECAGRLHYHLILWLPKGLKIDLVRLEKWWPWGSTWTEFCRKVANWSRYIRKCDNVANLPKGARGHGSGGLDDAGKTQVARAILPRWLLAQLPDGHTARRRRGGGWTDTLTGEVYRSPYIWTPRGIMPRRFRADTVGNTSPHHRTPPLVQWQNKPNRQGHEQE